MKPIKPSEAIEERSIKPVTPRQAVKDKVVIFPDEVFKVFNRLIVFHLRDGEASIDQDEIVKELVKEGLKRNEIFKNGWLDIEDVYARAGWEVEYDKPGYCETYEPTFTFRKK